MIGLGFAKPLTRVTCLGAHPDDIEIGAGGTLLHLASAYPHATFRFVIATGTPDRQAEAELSAKALLGDAVSVVFGGFDENVLPYESPAVVKAWIHQSVEPGSTDLVFAPQPGDLHQDHRFVAEVALQAFRDHLILGYEIPKSDGDFGRPSMYVGLERPTVDAKLDHLAGHFVSQHGKPWYERELFAAMLRLRGMEARSESGFAEAFYASRAVIG